MSEALKTGFQILADAGLMEQPVTEIGGMFILKSQKAKNQANLWLLTLGKTEDDQTPVKAWVGAKSITEGLVNPIADGHKFPTCSDKFEIYENQRENNALFIRNRERVRSTPLEV